MSPPKDRSWTEVTDCGPFTEHCAPVYVTRERLTSDEQIRFGFRVAPHHCNLRPVCHGGMLATFVDIAMARGLRFIGDIEPPLPTISMTMDYMAAAPLDAWVEGRVSVGRIGRTTAYVQVMLYVEDQPILRGSGIYRHFSKS